MTAALAVGVVHGPPTASAAAEPPRADQVAAAAQCSIGLGRGQRGTKKKALQLMAGRADLGKYGWFRLTKDPKWRPVSTLDSSGKGHMHSLHYLLPLLRRGVKADDRAMVDRFYSVLRDWVRDNKPGGRTSRYAWGPPIYEGFRAQVLVCAAAGPKGQKRWLRRALRKHGEMMADYRRYEGVNNASLHQSMGLYAIGVTMGRPAWRRLAITREQNLAVRLVHGDGSDEEGALTYAINNYRWFQQAAQRLRLAGDPVPQELLRVNATPGFIAHATRPDGRVEALGDTSPEPLETRRWNGTAAEFSATGGASGTAPGQTFASFDGGYVFGRSGWGAGKRDLADETFYSIRAGKADGIPHAHDDAASVTLYAHGSPLLLDTGQWRYTYGSTRSFVVSRAAHNVVLVNGARRTNPRPELRTTRVDGLDISTVVDRGYSGVTITRTVAYDRAEDVLLVWDRLESGKAVRASQQWGLGRDRDVRIEADAVHSSGPGADVSMLFTSGGAPLDVAKGRRSPMRGWNSQAYAELSPAPSVRATQKGTSLSWLTVITPRAEGVHAATTSATSAVSGRSASVVLTSAAGSATVTLDDAGGSRTAAGTLTPTTVVAPGVRAGRATPLRATGLTPSAPVSVETLPVGATAWTPVATGTASAAGTVGVRVAVPATADFRVVSGATASDPVRVTAAFPPAPPGDVTATPSGRGKVTVSWTPPADTGGVPLTGYVVRVDGVRRVVGAGATSLEFTKVRAGTRKVNVRAANAAARSPRAKTSVAVTPYPSVDGPSKVRKGSRVTLSLAGLLPRPKTTVTIKTTKNGKVVTRRVDPTNKGTATIRIRVRSTVKVFATSGGVRSAPHRIRARGR
jgi:hypothetical protein